MNRINDISVFGRKRSISPSSFQPALMALESRLVPASFSVDFAITNDWVSGFQAAVKVTNLDKIPVTGWKLSVAPKWLKEIAAAPAGSIM